MIFRKLYPILSRHTPGCSGPMRKRKSSWKAVSTTFVRRQSSWRSSDCLCISGARKTPLNLQLSQASLAAARTTRRRAQLGMLCDDGRGGAPVQQRGPALRGHAPADVLRRRRHRLLESLPLPPGFFVRCVVDEPREATFKSLMADVLALCMSSFSLTLALRCADGP